MHEKELPTLWEKEDSEGMALEGLMTSSTIKQVRSLRARLKELKRALCLGHHSCRRKDQSGIFLYHRSSKPPTSQYILILRQQAAPHPRNPVFSPGSLWGFLEKGYSRMSQHIPSDCSTRRRLVLAVHFIT